MVCYCFVAALRDPYAAWRCRFARVLHPRAEDSIAARDMPGKALRVIPRSKQRLTVSRARQVFTKMIRRAFLALRIIQRHGKWLVKTENNEAPSKSNTLQNNSGANRAQTGRRIREKYFHKNRNFSRARGQT